MKLSNKQLSKSNREGKAEIERLGKEILEFKGEKREEGMKAYRRLLLSSAEKLIYFVRS